MDSCITQNDMPAPDLPDRGSPYPFLGKVICITGAAGGIGMCAARILYARGASVALADVDANGLRIVEERLLQQPGG